MARIWFNKTFSSIHSALSLIRAADEAGEYRLICSSPNPHALVALAADEAAREPDGLTGATYVEWCLSFCHERSIDVFVPGKEASLIARHRADFLACGVRVLSAAPPETLELLHDKARFYAVARARDAPPPVFEVFETLAAFEDAHRRLRARYPALCMKPSESVYGIGFRRITETQSALDLLFDGNAYRIDLASLRAMLGSAARFRPMLLMPYLAGHEFSVDCVAHEGRLLCAIARRKPLDNDGQVIVVRDDIQRACAELSAQFQLNGNVNIQFREGDEGLRILEINPRLSGGIAMACLAGPNLPHLALTAFLRGPGAIRLPPIENGLRVGELNKAVRLAGEDT
ncbi:MAG: ATP-grasp domain-containing protein [Azoarcus sp.]|jgi:carbamoylphosphate synthase large subunit|nr:ATP-grasp domain-containing protein [Azoarcus sp.]